MKTYRIIYNGIEYKMKLTLKDVKEHLTETKKNGIISFSFENYFVFSEKENLIFDDYKFIIPISHKLANKIKSDINFKETI